jgi:radical SAM superfamily enzyme YgiQ (UPF0313 family)
MIANGQSKEDLRKILRRERPDFVVLDSTTPSIYSDIGCARIVKEESSAKVIMVGCHATVLPEETLGIDRGAVDVICLGEYDYAVKDVVEAFPSLSAVRGIVYRDNGGIKRTASRPPIENLDDLPFPAWRHLDLEKYFDAGKLYPYIDIISGRGCPNGCIFCLWPQVMHGTKYRLRSPENVIEEIKYDIELCPRVLKGGEFFFEDDTFTVDKERAIRICEAIMSSNLRITFSVNARMDTADLELFNIMKKAGCRELLTGFESGNQLMLDRMNKHVILDQSFKFMDYARQAKLDVHGCFVIGLPGETEESARETVDLALKLGLTTVQFSGAVPFPGTMFYQQCLDAGWLKTKNWSDWLENGEQSGIVGYDNFSREQINRYVDMGLRRFYFRPIYIFKFIFNTRSLSDLYRKVKGAINFLFYLIKK